MMADSLCFIYFIKIHIVNPHYMGTWGVLITDKYLHHELCTKLYSLFFSRGLFHAQTMIDYLWHPNLQINY